jgi:protein SCO1/2
MRSWTATVTAGLAALAFACLFASAALAQVSSYGDKQMGEVSDHPPALLDKVTITQKLNTRIPLDGEFRDETGKAVRLSEYFGKRPVVLSLVYYQCKIVCPEEIDGLVSALEMVKFVPGKDFDVVFVSIDPSETPEIAAKEKALYIKRYGHPETANGWHFLTGHQRSIL